jgi:hypothetical protein
MWLTVAAPPSEGPFLGKPKLDGPHRRLNSLRKHRCVELRAKCCPNAAQMLRCGRMLHRMLRTMLALHRDKYDHYSIFTVQTGAVARHRLAMENATASSVRQSAAAVDRNGQPRWHKAWVILVRERHAVRSACQTNSFECHRSRSMPGPRAQCGKECRKVKWRNHRQSPAKAQPSLVTPPGRRRSISPTVDDLLRSDNVQLRAAGERCHEPISPVRGMLCLARSCPPQSRRHAVGVRSRSSMEAPSGPLRKAMRVPGRTVTGPRVKTAPLAFRSAQTASISLTSRPK